MDGERIRLPDDFVATELERIAGDRVAESQGRDIPYGHSTVEGNKVGVKGEAAVMLWLRDRGFRFNGYEDPYRVMNPDIRAGKPGPPWIAIQVKTWPVWQWERGLAHCVAASQFRRVAERDWIVVWAIDDGTDLHGRTHVTLQGWTLTADLVNHGVAEWTAGLHPNVRVTQMLVRPMSELADVEPRTLRFPSLKAVELPCGHPNTLGMCWGCADAPAGAPLPERVAVYKGRYHAVDSSCPGQNGGAESIPLLDAILRCGACPRCYPLL